MHIPKKRYLIPAFVVIILLTRFVAEIGEDPTPADRFKVIRVLDGDTVELSGGDRLRLLGIDCPEKGEKFYDSATAFLSSLVLGQTLEVDFSFRRRDGYGRLLGYIYANKTFINEAILRTGLGHLYLFEDNMPDSAQIGKLLAAQKEAIFNSRGVWSLVKYEEPFYLAVRGGLRFHRPDCAVVKKRVITDIIRFSSRNEAFMDGYSPCRNCRP
jgi:micrococcal nuclease